MKTEKRKPKRRVYNLCLGLKVIFFKITFFQPINRHFRTHRMVHEIHGVHKLCWSLFVNRFAGFSRIVMPITVEIPDPI